MKDDYVIIQGKKDCLEVMLSQRATFFMVREALVQKLDSSGKFFEGSNLRVLITGKVLSAAQKREIRTILETRYSMKRIEFEEDMPKTVPVAAVKENKGVALSGFIYSTIRSGQRIESNGDIVVIGDVNPGAQLIAGGSILVMGMLRGMAHAGAAGDDTATVTALQLNPAQLRIAGIIAVAPDGIDAVSLEYPEIARAISGEIVIEPVHMLKKEKH